MRTSHVSFRAIGFYVITLSMMAVSYTHLLDWWQSTERNGVKYTALPARHDSSRGLFDHNKALWSGFLIEHKCEMCIRDRDKPRKPLIG